jgi:hypothetical protein
MQRSCADVNSLYKRSAELIQRALYLIHYSETQPSTTQLELTVSRSFAVPSRPEGTATLLAASIVT